MRDPRYPNDSITKEAYAARQDKHKKHILKLLGKTGAGQIQIVGVGHTRTGKGHFLIQIIKGSQGHNVTSQMADVLGIGLKYSGAGAATIFWGGDPRGGGYSDSQYRLLFAIGEALFNDYDTFQSAKHGQRRADVIY